MTDTVWTGGQASRLASFVAGALALGLLSPVLAAEPRAPRPRVEMVVGGLVRPRAPIGAAFDAERHLYVLEHYGRRLLRIAAGRPPLPLNRRRQPLRARRADRAGPPGRVGRRRPGRWPRGALAGAGGAGRLARPGGPETAVRGAA